MKDNPQTKKLIDAPYNRSINYSTKILYQRFKTDLIKKGILKKPLEKKPLDFLINIDKSKYILTEKQKNGLIVLLTVVIMATAICSFCRKTK